MIPIVQSRHVCVWVSASGDSGNKITELLKVSQIYLVLPKALSTFIKQQFRPRFVFLVHSYVTLSTQTDTHVPTGGVFTVHVYPVHVLKHIVPHSPSLRRFEAKNHREEKASQLPYS